MLIWQLESRQGTAAEKVLSERCCFPHILSCCREQPRAHRVCDFIYTADWHAAGNKWRSRRHETQIAVGTWSSLYSQGWKKCLFSCLFICLFCFHVLSIGLTSWAFDKLTLNFVWTFICLSGWIKTTLSVILLLIKWHPEVNISICPMLWQHEWGLLCLSSLWNKMFCTKQKAQCPLCPHIHMESVQEVTKKALFLKVARGISAECALHMEDRMIKGHCTHEPSKKEHSIASHTWLSRLNLWLVYFLPSVAALMLHATVITFQPPSGHFPPRTSEHTSVLNGLLCLDPSCVRESVCTVFTWPRSTGISLKHTVF